MTPFEIKLNPYQTLGLCVLVLLFGRFVVNKVGFLRRFCIPAPVVGGLIFAIVNLIGYESGAFMFTLGMDFKDLFMIMFFTTIGFSASVEVLKKGGIGVVIFLIISAVLCIIQDAVGAGIASAMGQNPLLGLCAGSVSMTGGHGTSAAYGPVIEQAGLEGATTLAIAAATFGLISGSLIGGPTAAQLINKNNLHSEAANNVDSEGDLEAITGKVEPLNSRHFCDAFFQLAIAIGLGNIVSLLINKTGFTVPAYIGSMLIAVLMRNIFKSDSGKVFATRAQEISVLGDVSLQIFLAEALCDLKLWQLAAMALPLLVILLSQCVIMYLYARFVTFRIMGKDYEAAVLAAGHCGFGMGATPNGMANMDAVTSKYGPAPRAYFILPIVGGMFIDFFNAIIITAFINFLA